MAALISQPGLVDNVNFDHELGFRNSRSGESRGLNPFSTMHARVRGDDRSSGIASDG
jgi:hypothetical protein